MQPLQMQVILHDGDYSGRIEFKFDYTFGVVYKIPKDKLNECKNFHSINNPGIYLLCGDRTEAHPKIYIGQATQRQNNESVLPRLNEHFKDVSKDFCKEIIFITNEKTYLTEDKLCYLEYTLWDLAKKAGSFEVTNLKQPSSMGSRDKISLDILVHNIRVIMQLIGYDVFDAYTIKRSIQTASSKVPSSQTEIVQKIANNQAQVGTSNASGKQLTKTKSSSTRGFNPIEQLAAKSNLADISKIVYFNDEAYQALLSCEDGRFKAHVILLDPNKPVKQAKRCFMTCGSRDAPENRALKTEAWISKNNETILIEGGFISVQTSLCCTSTLIKFRKVLLDEGYIESFNDHLYRLKASILFTSSSTAGFFIKGYNMNGPESWTITGTEEKISSWLD